MATSVAPVLVCTRERNRPLSHRRPLAVAGDVTSYAEPGAIASRALNSPASAAACCREGLGGYGQVALTAAASASGSVTRLTEERSTNHAAKFIRRPISGACRNQLDGCGRGLFLDSVRVTWLSARV